MGPETNDCAVEDQHQITALLKRLNEGQDEDSQNIKGRYLCSAQY
jgi:hypothetical protein